MKVASVIVVCAIAMGGCATSPVPLANAVPVPAARAVAFQNGSSASSATIVVTRDKGMMGGACYYALYINGTLAARIATRETATFHVAPGETVLRYGRDPEGKGLCSGGKSYWTEHETILRRGEVKHFRLTADANGKLGIERAEGINP